MARVTPEEYAEKWSRRLKGSTEDIRRGVDKVTESPALAAIRSQALMMQRLIESIQDGTWAAQLGKVSVEDWRNSLKTKGLGRIAAGVDAATPAQREMAQSLLAAVDAAAAKVAAMPKGSLEDSIARMTTFVREMAQRAPRRPRGR